MEANKNRNIRSGTEYNRLFPGSENGTRTIKKNANVDHTIAFIPKVVNDTLDQTKLISEKLKGRTIYETCTNIWQFVYQHINYKKDQQGYEQIRSPARTWHDRRQGVDCDCYSVFISSILTNLLVPHILRITKYRQDYFQHIYPVVPLNGKEIKMDCVTDQFNYEVPYSEKKDYPMDLHYLNGFDGDGTGELGKLFAKKRAKKKQVPLKAKAIQQLHKKATPALHKKINAKAVSKSSPKTPAFSPSPLPAVKKKKGFFKKVLNKINKINPATVLLRNGILAAMKLNYKNVAKRLRWSYLSQEQAVAKGIDPAKFPKLLATRQKLENIFYGAGGKMENLKKAILGGKGNKNKAVNGLGMLPLDDWQGYMSEYAPLNVLLGQDIYYSENIEGMEGFGELGEPLTLTSVAAAAGVIAGIVASLKQVGDIFSGKGKGSQDFDESKTDAPENSVALPPTNQLAPSTASTSTADLVSQGQSQYVPGNLPDRNKVTPSNEIINNPVYPIQDETNNPVVVMNENPSSEIIAPLITTRTETTPMTTDTQANDKSGKQGFWDKNKSWLKPTAIGVGGIGLIVLGIKLFKDPKPSNKFFPKSHSLSGMPKKKKKKKKHHGGKKTKHQHKKAVALL